MSDAASLLAGLGNTPDPFFLAIVADLTDDGHANLDLGDSVLPDVPCSSSYSNRLVGDRVIVVNARSGKLVLGAVNQPDPTSVRAEEIDALRDEITDKVDETQDYATGVRGYADVLSQQIDRIDNVLPDVSFGTSAPAGFTQADSVWYRDQGGGRVDIAFVKAAAGTPTTKPTKPPATSPTAPKKIPKPTTKTPAWRGSWRTNGQTDDAVWQGDWTGRGNWLGGWGFESRISDACAGHNVNSMTFKVARTDDGSGWNRGVPANLHLFSRSSKGKPSKMGSGITVSLSPGASKTVTLPSSWVGALASGSARGIMASGSGRSSYIKFSGSSGALRVTFNRDS